MTKIINIAIIGTLIFGIPAIASAQNVGDVIDVVEDIVGEDNEQEVKIDNPLGEGSTLWTLLDRIVAFIYIISFSVAVILFIFSGYRFIMAAGDPEKINSAKKMVWWTIIGLMIIIAANGIIDLVVNEILGANVNVNP
jgi:hypothetical protein